jgi:small subunit ribosomal protein S18
MSDFSRKPKRRYCAFCKDKVEYLDYKDVNMLRKYMTDRGKIKPRRVSGNCAQHQHQLSTAVKRAREMVPYTVPVVSNKVDGKGRR